MKKMISLLSFFFMLLMLASPVKAESMNLFTAAKKHILEAKRLIKKTNSYLRFRSRKRGFRGRIKVDRKFTQLYKAEYPIYKLMDQIHDNAVAKDDISLEMFRNNLKQINMQFDLFVQAKYFSYISKSARADIEEFAMHITELNSILADEDLNITEGKFLQKYSKVFKQKEEIEYQRAGQYQELYDQVVLLYKASKSFYKKQKKISYSEQKSSETIQKKRSQKYKELKSQFLPIYKISKDLLADLKDSFEDQNEKVNLSHIAAQILVLKTSLKKYITYFNSLHVESDYKFELNEIDKKLISIFDKLRVHKQILKDNDQTISAKVQLREKVFKYTRATQVCSSLGTPGNIILRKSQNKDIDMYSDFGPNTANIIKFLEKAKGNNVDLKFRHAEVVTKIEKDTNITTMSFYPWLFNIGKQEHEKMPSYLEIKKGYKKCIGGKCTSYRDYRTNFAMLRVKASSLKGERKRLEKSLSKVDNKKYYSKAGVCSDFVNWAYGNVITSNWNFIPVVKNVVQMVWIPEAWQTPDNLYDSYMTERVCEVENRKLTFPQRVNASSWVQRVISQSQSSRAEIKEHALKVLEELKKQDIIDDNHNLLVDIVTFKSRFER